MEDGSPFAMAGIWENWKNPDGEYVRTFCILTTEANALVRKIHDRMPVILRGSDYAKWLGQEPATEADLKAMPKPYPSEPMSMQPVMTRMNNARYKEADSIDPIEADPLDT